jgi:hypothetical protein
MIGLVLLAFFLGWMAANIIGLMSEITTYNAQINQYLRQHCVCVSGTIRPNNPMYIPFNLTKVGG